MVTTKYKYKNSNDSYYITTGHPGCDDDDSDNITMMIMTMIVII